MAKTIRLGDPGSYTAMDRWVHNLAFGGQQITSLAVDLENGPFRKGWENMRVARPVFLTSLPRAGTTILLEAFARLPHVATHTYRDMPFIMAPYFWSKFSSTFQRESALQERAHGDGINIGFDSPEAFEEVLWKHFFPTHYKDDRIALWSADEPTGGFAPFLRDHMKKIAALRRPDETGATHYVSKNNANIARIPLLRTLFPESHMLVPFRAPLEHAYSLFKQHQRLGEMQQRDPFAKKYMADIGHLEFGPLHKPLAFPGFTPASNAEDAAAPSYWLRYWIAAFEYLIALPDTSATFFSYEGMTTRGSAAFATLAREALGIAEDDARAAGEVIKPSPPPSADESAFDPESVNKANEIHRALLDRCRISSQDRET